MWPATWDTACIAVFCGQLAGSLMQKTVLITGGSSGVGAELVRTFVEGEYAVWFTYNSGRSRADSLLESLPPGSNAKVSHVHEQAKHLHTESPAALLLQRVLEQHQIQADSCKNSRLHPSKVWCKSVVCGNQQIGFEQCSCTEAGKQLGCPSVANKAVDASSCQHVTPLLQASKQSVT